MVGWLLLVVRYDKTSIMPGIISDVPKIGSHQHQPPTLNMCIN